MCIEHTGSAHGAQAGALAATLLKTGQKQGSADPDGESWPVTGADAAAMLSKMRSTDPSLPPMKQEAAVKLLRYVCPCKVWLVIHGLTLTLEGNAPLSCKEAVSYK